MRRATAAVASTATLLTPLSTPVLALASGSPIASAATTSDLGDTAHMKWGNVAVRIYVSGKGKHRRARQLLHRAPALGADQAVTGQRAVQGAHRCDDAAE